MRDHRRHIRTVGGQVEETAEMRLTKHWYERPLTKKVKAIGALAGALAAIGSVFGGAGRIISHQADAALVQVIRREVAPIVATQQTDSRISAEQRAEIKASIDLLRADVQALRAAVEKPKRKR